MDTEKKSCTKALPIGIASSLVGFNVMCYVLLIACAVRSYRNVKYVQNVWYVQSVTGVTRGVTFFLVPNLLCYKELLIPGDTGDTVATAVKTGSKNVAYI